MTKKDYATRSPDGVSESIGFLLIFTLVIVGIGLVTLYGYPMLLQQQISADEQIMEKNMIVLQNDVKSLAYKTVPYKETSLKIGGGSLTVYNSTYTPPVAKITIRDNLFNTHLNEFQSGDLRYHSETSATDISIQNGAVLKRQTAQKGAVMLAEPRWFYDPSTKTLVVNLVNLTSTGPISRSGIGTVQMALGETQFLIADTDAVPQTLGNKIYLDYVPDPDNDYSLAWDTYFKNTLGMSVDSGTPGSGGTVTYTLPLNYVSRLVIKQYEVDVISV